MDQLHSLSKLHEPIVYFGGWLFSTQSQFQAYHKDPKFWNLIVQFQTQSLTRCHTQYPNRLQGPPPLLGYPRD